MASADTIPAFHTLDRQADPATRRAVLGLHVRAIRRFALRTRAFYDCAAAPHVLDDRVMHRVPVTLFAAIGFELARDDRAHSPAPSAPSERHGSGFLSVQGHAYSIREIAANLELAAAVHVAVEPRRFAAQRFRNPDEILTGRRD